MAVDTHTMPSGRPSDFTQELGAAICEAIATTPRGLDFICAGNEAFPSASTVHRWLTTDTTFRESYLRARERQADLIFDECLEIADDGSQDVRIETRDDGSSYEHYDAERVARSKLRVDTRMRMAGKLSPKKYGEKVALVGGGPDDPPLIPETTHRDRAKAIAAVFAKAKHAKDGD